MHVDQQIYSQYLCNSLWGLSSDDGVICAGHWTEVAMPCQVGTLGLQALYHLLFKDNKRVRTEH